MKMTIATLMCSEIELISFVSTLMSGWTFQSIFSMPTSETVGSVKGCLKSVTIRTLTISFVSRNARVMT